MEPGNKLFTILIKQDLHLGTSQKFPDIINLIHTIPSCKLNKTEQCENVVETTFVGSSEEIKDHGIHI